MPSLEHVSNGLLDSEMELTILSESDVRACVDMDTAIDLMADAFTALSRRTATTPVRSRVDSERGVTLLMPALLPAVGGPSTVEAPDGEEPSSVVGEALGAKVVTVFPRNPRRGLPTIHAVILVIEPETGAPASIMDGTFVTALRTGAASGLATRLLAREDARILTVFGAGAQARTQIEAVRAVRSVEEVRVVARSRESAEVLCGELVGVRAIALEDRAAALRGADVVVTATDSPEPVFKGTDVEPGTHVNGVGSYTADMTEVDQDLVVGAYVVVDSREAALEEAGDLIQPILSGAIGSDHLRAELGEVVTGRREGRTSEDQVTFFKSVGVAVQDMAVARHVVGEARRRRLGQRVAL